jgi:hypothetical protein
VDVAAKQNARTLRSSQYHNVILRLNTLNKEYHSKRKTKIHSCN